MGAPQMTPEHAILQAAPHIQPGPGVGRSYSVDSSMDGSMDHSVQYHQHDGSFARHGSSLSMGDMGSFADHNGPMLQPKNGITVDSMAIAQKPASRTSANNEREMQQLYVANKHRSLQDVARELHGNERGPNSERQRQVFAMLW
jgi:regulatory factor X